MLLLLLWEVGSSRSGRSRICSCLAVTLNYPNHTEGELLFWEAGQQLPNPANIQPSGQKRSPEPTACSQGDELQVRVGGWELPGNGRALCSLLLCRLETPGMIWDKADLRNCTFPCFLNASHTDRPGELE